MRQGSHPVDIHIGLRLRQRRTALGISQPKLAAALGIAYQQLSKYEQAVNRISASRLYELGQVLDVPVTFFFEGIAETEATAQKPTAMTGRPRLPSGEPRKASQGDARRAVAAGARARATPVWRAGIPVLWKDRIGIFRREVDGEHAEVVIEGRVYRVRIIELS
jgi:transcriptional regulator with XRE-family HTH domain